MPDISGELGTVSAGTVAPARAVPLSGWFGQRKFAALAGTYGAASVGSIGYTTGIAYWVSPTGAATWANARSVAPLSGTACCSIATANANAAAGDMVYLRGGDYNITLKPSNSGTLGNRITFIAYPGETPRFTAITDYRWAIKLQGASYIVVHGITSYHCGSFFYLGDGACYNEIKNCTFSEDLVVMYQAGEICYWSSAGVAGSASSHNWIHHCVFTKYGAVSDGQDIGTIRVNRAYDDPSSNNTIEDCVFSHAGHDCLEINGRYNVARNNVFHNDETYFVDPGGCYNSPSTSGYFGNRCLLISNSGMSYVGTAYHNLIERNRIGHSGMPPDDNGAHCIENAGCHTLIRHNYVYNAAGTGIYFKTQPAPGPGVTLKSGSWSRVCNNSVYHSGYGDEKIGDGFKHGIQAIGIATAEYWPWPEDVSIKNNIFYETHSSVTDWPIAPREYEITYENNWETTDGNPLFVDTTMTNHESTVLPDLTLGSGSPCIEAGTYLTQANGSGTNSTTLIVDDALWFQDGTWGSALTHGATLFPDWIAIGTVGNVVQISSINYDTKVITLASPMTWSDDAPIWLYKDSSGTRVLYGTAPNQGADQVTK